MLNIPREPTKGDEILPWATRVQDCLRRLRITGGPGVIIQSTANGTSISFDPRGRKASSLPVLPFEVRLVKVGEERKAMVLKGDVYLSLRPGDRYADTIEGLTIKEEEPQYLTGTIEHGKRICLVISLDEEGEAKSMAIKADEDMDPALPAWEEKAYVQRAQQEPWHQTKAVLVLAWIEAEGDPPELVVRQNVRTDLLLVNMCIDGQAAIYPIPWSGGYPV